MRQSRKWPLGFAILCLTVPFSFHIKEGIAYWYWAGYEWIPIISFAFGVALAIWLYWTRSVSAQS